MVLMECFIVLLLISVSGWVLLWVYWAKKRRKEYGNQQNTITLLKMQNARNRMTSHFFFNALSGISTETNDPALVKNDLKKLAMLLRHSIENIEQTGISLREELEVVRGYLDLQKWRIPEPFHVDFDISEDISPDFLIPAMCIQIPVENAIKHGLMPLKYDKLLSVAVLATAGGLKIEIKDNGIGISASPNRTMGTGTGLKVLIQTISLLNSKNIPKIVFSISEQKPVQISSGGTIVSISVPSNYKFI